VKYFGIISFAEASAGTIYTSCGCSSLYCFGKRTKLPLWLLLSYTLRHFYASSFVCMWSFFPSKVETTAGIVQGLGGP